MLLPVASAVLCFLVLLTILGVPAALGLLSAGYALAVFIAFCLVSSFVIIFFNAALVACAKIRFDGGDPTIRQGLSVAWTRAGKILQEHHCSDRRCGAQGLEAERRAVGGDRFGDRGSCLGRLHLLRDSGNPV